MDLALGVAVVVATLLGPVLAVWVTRSVDAGRRVKDRRLEIFRALMSTRRAPLSAERVKALNMVEIDFYGVKAVEKAHRDVMENINVTKPLPAGWDEKHRKLLTKLLSEMAASLKYTIQQIDVLDGGYYPQGLIDIEIEQQAVRQALIQVLSGNRPLTVSATAPTPPAPFPPPPAPPAGSQ